ncbi:MAG TPA: diaminopimelate decarboxylase [Asanoa sp.]|nr:diaminopimelate decarboxylase [Asanoa sp.]
MRAHEAGALHGDFGQGPAWLRTPDDVNALVPQLWPRGVARDADGALTVTGLGVERIRAEYGTPAYVLDEDDLRARAREFRQAFAGHDIYYAGKAFLCRAVVRAIDEEGLFLDVCTGGELATALSAGMPPERIGFHGNNKSLTELERAVDAGVGRIIVDSFDEIDRLTALAREKNIRQAVLVRVTVGVEAHTHEFIATAHEDQKFGFSVGGGAAFKAVCKILDDDALDLRGLHSHIGSQIFDASGFEVSARRVLALQAQIRDARGVELPEIDLGGGFGIAYTTQDDPSDPAQLATEMGKIVEHECRAFEVDVPKVSIEPGRAIVGPAVCTVYTVGTVKEVQFDAGASRTYVSVDGGMSDNIRTALYDADYSCTLANRYSESDPTLARVVGKHCESGDIVVKDEFVPADVTPGDLIAVPGTGAYCRSMASNYNHVPRPPVIAVKDGRTRVVIRRETEDDLLSLDMGAE